jgi:A/G-specific adenine glycosylase
MLQQTTVAMAAPRFEPFISAFPTVHALAAADEQAVLRHWEGLGYYRRARSLHQAARLLVDSHNGELRNEPKLWARLPGVGRYILGAVLSQAFDRRMPIVEANTRRVIARLIGQKGDITSAAVDKWLWQTAEALLPRRRAGDFNQALMELGALVCTPADPRCQECPLASQCVARRENVQDRIPLKPAPPRAIEVREVAVVVRKGRRVLLVQRPNGGRWSNMWEFPHGSLEPKENQRTAARRLLRDSLGVRADLGGELLTVRHAVTRFRITMVCLEAHLRSDSVIPAYHKDARWLLPTELINFPVGVAQRKLATELLRLSRPRVPCQLEDK